ncbi:tripartite tricarboxylate transporter substrate binding protein [Variovorax sp. WS11]|uniref:Bug family tripartite tricarboxylate transporter substrate binding protein n=1 Tax=Variovorax sp. WS11 TaxID=1105204 RepID=UPI0015E747A4|nr:tripartite tricarboxylate transporter substrate-binding protein [Variovorax sp. WS11]
MAASAAIPAFAQAYPSRPIKFIVPYAAGGGTDLLIRALQDPLSKSLGQPVIVDNRSGAAGAIGAREVARAAPDGYTFLVSNNGPSIIVPLLQKEAGYDPIKDFTPVTTIATAPIVLVAHSSVPAADVRKFIDWARTEPQGVAYASAGVGSIGHLAAEQFAKVTNLKFVHVPYRGQAPTIAAVLAGESPIGFTSASDALLAHLQAGKIRLLGIGSEQPSALIPGGIPIGASVPGYRADFWQGILAPAKTPDAIVAKVHDAIVDALKVPEMEARFARMSYSATHAAPSQFAKSLASEVDVWKTLIRERGIRGES